ncbi:hypothetical protein [Pelomonas sp. KK5]|uniref:hypothetical protein n=1 Tax=Pelomonas sp. KK5 TaxID=1855730 RepID=UPI00097C1A5D|nr:hypothetical protein [Pelomonas sp. KK5]
MNFTTPERLQQPLPVLDTEAAAVSSVHPLHEHALCWRAVLAGAAGAAALSLILLVLGMGLGLSAVSPWSQAGIAATTFGLSTILWVTLTQVAASGLGGYLAGRLRGGWQRASTDETHFRDTTHGFLAWAVATLATAAALTGAIGGVLGSGAQATALGAGAAVNSTSRYFESSLFRPAPNLPATADPVPAATVSEMADIFANAGRSPTLPPSDQTYVAQLVARHDGISQQAAEKRVADVYAAAQLKLQRAQEAADQARKAGAHAALWLFVSLLAGAFVASLMAVFGGRQRDADAVLVVAA